MMRRAREILDSFGRLVDMEGNADSSRTGNAAAAKVEYNIDALPPLDPSVKGSGENLYVLWSGGIDTTAVVVAFLRILSEFPEYHEKYAHRIVIAYCERSIKEYPWFFEKYIDPGVS